MLELKAVQYTLPRDEADLHLLNEVSINVKPGHFMAIVGPSGCGKTTLLKVIAGLQLETSGQILWRGEDVSEGGDIKPQELGYVPQFSIAFDHLTVEECVEMSAKLRTRASGDELYDITDRVIAEVGMENSRTKRVSVLSGGQKRRLGLAMELVSQPTLLLCDEVTSGLDPQGERDIVQLLHSLSLKDDRIVVNVTHSLMNLDLYDSVLVMFEGHVVYHGTPDAMPHYFSADTAVAVYPMLAKRKAADWHESWLKYRDAYYEKLDQRLIARPHPAPVAATTDDGTPVTHDDANHEPPSQLRQFFVLTSRRWKLFFRDRMQIFLHLALLFGFPLLVVIFATDGMPAMPELNVPDTLEGMKARAHNVERQVKSADSFPGSLCSR